MPVVFFLGGQWTKPISYRFTLCYYNGTWSLSSNFSCLYSNLHSLCWLYSHQLKGLKYLDIFFAPSRGTWHTSFPATGIVIELLLNVTPGFGSKSVVTALHCINWVFLECLWWAPAEVTEPSLKCEHFDAIRANRRFCRCDVESIFLGARALLVAMIIVAKTCDIFTDIYQK